VRNSYGWAPVCEKCIWVIGIVWKIRMGDCVCVRNSYGWSALYEKFVWVIVFVWEIHTGERLCVRNSYGRSGLYEKFGFIWEIHMASPVCTRNSCRWSCMYEKFTNHGHTAIQRVNFQISNVSRNKNINAQSNFLPPSSGSNLTLM